MFVTIHAKTGTSGDDYQDFVINTKHISYINPLKFYVNLGLGDEIKSFIVLGKDFPVFLEDLITLEGVKNG